MIRNKTKDTIVSSDYKFADSFIDKAFGLLLSSNPRTLIFRTRFGIHTFFMKEKMDVIVLDNTNRVVKIKKDLLPNKIFFWNPKFSLIVELPGGSIRKSKIEVGDAISFV